MDPTAGRPPPQETVVRPSGGWQSLELGEILGARELMAILTWRDVKVRYKQTILGAAWALMQPVAMTAVFAFILQHWGRMEPGELPFVLYVYVGMWIWVFFSTALTTSANSVVSAERVVTKVYFPRLTIPFAAVLASLVDFAIAILPFLVLALWYGVAPSWGWLLAPVIVSLVALLAMGIGAGLSALMVVFRDVRYVLPFLVQLLLFATPSIFLATSAGGVERGPGLLLLHPLDGLVASFRAAILGGDIPWLQFGTSSALTVAVFLGGCLVFRRLEDTFADVI